MSSYDVTLTSATRQNLLSLQDTASLVATNQTRLSTGKKVNSALDNPVNFFTSQSLTARSTSLSGILDGISNGIQSIQAANQGITSVQKLIDSAKSLTSQALASKNSTTTGATAGSATGTASTAFATLGAATPVTFTVGNGSAVTANLTTSDTIDTAITKLNGAVGGGSTIFGKDGSGNLTITSPGGDVAFTAGSTAIGFATADITHTPASAGTTTADATRTSLATQYNALLTQIDQLAKDASYNGVNLISSNAGTNKLHVSFNEKDTSGLDVQGVDMTSTGLGLAPITGNFQTDTEVNDAITKLTTATSTLSAQAATFGSNLTVVQNRQDFSKQLINVLQTGSDNLTNADMNAEAANSQALSTRQSLGISALSLANTAQQGILQLLR